MFKKIYLISLMLAVLVGSAGASYGWKFASIADSRGDTNGVNVAMLSRIVAKINAENVDLVIFEGDMVNGTSDNTALASMYDTWIVEMNKLNCPYYATVGNHEISSSTSEDVFRAKLNMPTNGPAGYLETVYSFDHNDAHFAALNSNHYGEAQHVQRSWLATDLAGNTKPHVFVFAHEPGYPAGPHSGDSLNQYLSERDDFWNIMSKAGAGMYFCGHEHLYQRSKQGNIIQVINGSCGAPLHTGYPNTTANYQYVIVNIDGNNVHSEARNDSGVLFDSWDYKLAPTCDSLRFMDNGNTGAILKNKIVTYTAGNAAYVEEADRSCAFRVAGAGAVTPGTKLNVVGTLRTLSTGERELNGTAVTVSTGNTVPKPVVMTVKNLVGGERGNNPHPEGGTGLNNYGLLVRLCGKVTSIGTGSDAGYFYIDDGSGITDNTVWNGIPNAGVRVRSAQTVTKDSTVTVTGISSVFNNAGLTCRLLYVSDPVQPVLPFTAYNDCVYTSPQPTPLANVTTYTPLGNGIPSGAVSSGKLKDFTTGTVTGVTATLSQSNGVNYQPALDTGGCEPNSGTDAYNLFTALGVGVAGVVYYGTNPWYVDLAFTGLDPAKRYELATTANRNGTTTSYDNRYTTFTLSGADAYTNTSSSGTTIAGASTSFNTGKNTTTGYVVRWTNINPGTDGTFKVRAAPTNATTQNNTYAFSVFMLKQLP